MTADEVRRALKEAGIHQEDVARELGVSQTHVCNVLNDHEGRSSLRSKATVLDKAMEMIEDTLDGRNRIEQHQRTIEMAKATVPVSRKTSRRCMLCKSVMPPGTGRYELFCQTCIQKVWSGNYDDENGNSKA